MRDIRRPIAVALVVAVLVLGADAAAGRAASGRLRPADDGLTIPLSEVLARESAAGRAKFEEEGPATHAAVYVDGERVGGIHTGHDGHGGHDVVESGSLGRALDVAARRAQGDDVVVDLVLDRAPCGNRTCDALTVHTARRFAAVDIRFRVVTTGAHLGPGRPNLPATVRWSTRMLDTGAEVLVGVPSGGRVSPGGQWLLTALRSVARGPATEALAGGAMGSRAGHEPDRHHPRRAGRGTDQEGEMGEIREGEWVR